MWTKFWDMNSGGGRKEKWSRIYIEAPEEEAVTIFYNRFGHNPHRVSCTCCGADYSVSSEEDLAQITGYERGCDYAYFNTKEEEVTEQQATSKGKTSFLKRGYKNEYVERQCKMSRSYITLKDYIESDYVLIIFSKDIKDSEREGNAPEQGYVWR